MQTSVLRKLLQLIKNETPREEKLSEATLELSQADNETEETLSSEFEIENKNEEEICEEPCEEINPAPTENNRAHLTSSVPRAAKAPIGILTKGELAEIRALFKNIDDNEIQRLYKKVTK